MAAGAGTGAALAVAAPAAAQDFTVTALGPDGAPGTLRAQVDAANASPGADRIVFQSGLTGTIEVESRIGVDGPLEIAGPGAATLAVSGGGDTGLFAIGNPQSQQPIDVGISGLTLKDGGQTSYGAAIDAMRSNLEISDSVITGNAADTGGAVYAGMEGSLTVTATTFSRNSGSAGGAIATYGTPATIDSSTFSRNIAQGAGGGILVGPAPVESSLTVVNSTFNRNGGGVLGGAMASMSDELTETSLDLRSSTISGNQAAAFGGGIGGFSSAKIGNSVIENNFAIYGPDLYSGSLGGPGGGGGGGDGGDCGCYPQTPFDTEFSFIGDTAGAEINTTVANSNILDGGDALLGRLADNGGPTQTMAIESDSPLVNKGSSPLTTDQRGEKRPVAYPGVPDSTAAGANGADIGAFELQYVEPPPPPPPPPPVKNWPLRILGSKPHADGTATVRVRVPAAGDVTLVGYKRLKTVSKRANAKGVLKFKAIPKGKLKKKLGKRGHARVLVKFRYKPDEGRTLSKGRVFPFVKGIRGKKSAVSELRESRRLGTWAGE